MNALRWHKDPQNLLKYALVRLEGRLSPPRPCALDPHGYVVVQDFFGEPLFLLGRKFFDPSHGLGVFDRPPARRAGRPGARAQPPVKACLVVRVPAPKAVPLLVASFLHAYGAFEPLGFVGVKPALNALEGDSNLARAFLFGHCAAHVVRGCG